MNLIDVGSHLADSHIIANARPTLVAGAVMAMWATVGAPAVAQLDNHSNFRGGIPLNWSRFGPVVAAYDGTGGHPRFVPSCSIPDAHIAQIGRLAPIWGAVGSGHAT